MRAAFLDTTALVDLLFKDRETRQKVKSCCATEAKTISSQYVIYELARGFLRNLIVLYNASLRYERLTELYDYWGSVRRRQYLAGAIVGAFKTYDREAKRLFGFQPRTDRDSSDLKHFRFWLKYNIQHNWRLVFRSLDEIVNKVNCRTQIGDPYLSNNEFDQKLQKQLCGRAGMCGLQTYLSWHHGEFLGLRGELKKLLCEDRETVRRVEAIAGLQDCLQSHFRRQDCYDTGDALIVHEAPADSKIVSKNKAHFERLCKILGRNCEFYV